MAWRLSGQFIETCSCNMLCPCWFGVPQLAVQDQGWCATAAAVRVREGESDGVSLAGQTVVIAFDFPDVIFNGGGTGRLYLDERASTEQRQALEAIFSGEQGGPMEALSALLATWLPSRTTAIDVSEDGDDVSIAVGDIGRVESRRLRDGEGKDFTLRGGGFLTGLRMESLELAPSSSRWADPEMPRQFETKSGGRSPISWSA
jgi:hypothetical protein